MTGFEKIGEKIRYYRAQRGLDKKTVAKRAELSESRYEEIENGQAIYQLGTLQKISVILEIDLPELLDFE